MQNIKVKVNLYLIKLILNQLKRLKLNLAKKYNILDH
jgi:hypothetical protein